VNLRGFRINVLHSMSEEALQTVPNIPPLLHLHRLEILSPPGFAPNLTGHIQLLNKLTVPTLRELIFPSGDIRS
jgi:hypothetical protein